MTETGPVRKGRDRRPISVWSLLGILLAVWIVLAVVSVTALLGSC